MLTHRRLLAVFVAVAPSLVLVPAVFVPIPTMSHPGVEVASYFQTLALMTDGLGSYTYLTPLESGAGLHLHAWMSAPLLAAGVTEAGRVVSLLAAVGSCLLLWGLGSRLLDWRAGVFAAALVWLHPLFGRFATRWYPESLGIFLTAGAVYAALRDDGDRRWYGLALAALALGVANHHWEASVALPLTALYLRRGTVARAGGVVTATLVSLGAVEAVQTLQPAGASLVESYSVWERPEALFRVDWLFQDGLEFGSPVEPAVSLTVPIALATVALLALATASDPTEPRLLLLTWLLSGLAVLVALPRGWQYHDYYLWGVLAPLALSGGLGLALATEYAATRTRVRADAVAEYLVVGLLCAALFYGAAVEVGPAGPDRHSDVEWADGDDYREAGRELATYDVEDPSNVTFAGAWHFDTIEPSYLDRPDVVRILIYGEVPLEGRTLPESDRRPNFLADGESVNTSACTVAVIRDGDGVHVAPCR